MPARGARALRGLCSRLLLRPLAPLPDLPAAPRPRRPVIIATPMDLRRVIHINKPTTAAKYAVEDREAPFLRCACLPGPRPQLLRQRPLQLLPPAGAGAEAPCAAPPLPTPRSEEVDKLVASYYKREATKAEQ